MHSVRVMLHSLCTVTVAYKIILLISVQLASLLYSNTAGMYYSGGTVLAPAILFLALLIMVSTSLCSLIFTAAISGTQS